MIKDILKSILHTEKKKKDPDRDRGVVGDKVNRKGKYIIKKDILNNINEKY